MDFHRKSCQIGRGQKSLYTLHKRAAGNNIGDTPGGRRMWAVIARRQANWDALREARK